jgi:hypothetical protein
MLHRIKARLITEPAARLVTGPAAFLLGGVIDVAAFGAGSLRARIRDRRRRGSAGGTTPPPSL